MYAVTPATVPAASPIATASEVLAPAAFAKPPARAPAPAPNNAPFASGERFSHPVVRNRPATKIADEVLISPGFINSFCEPSHYSSPTLADKHYRQVASVRPRRTFEG